MKESSINRQNSKDKKSLVPFNAKELEKMLKHGYTHVQVNGYTIDRSLDFVHPQYIILTPVKSDTTTESDSGIFEPIHSELLAIWANTEEGIKILVSYG